MATLPMGLEGRVRDFSAAWACACDCACSCEGVGASVRRRSPDDDLTIPPLLVLGP